MTTSNQWVMGECRGDGACIENDKGQNVVWVERVPRGPDSSEYRTTDEQWQAIIDQIAAVPEMLALLKEARFILSHHKYGNMSVASGEVLISRIDEVIAKAEPPRPIKRKVTITTEVEVEVFSDAPDDVVLQMGEERVRDGRGRVTCKRVIV